jgi:hypothetical protein
MAVPMTGDEIRAQREKCADCGGQLQEIKVYCTSEADEQIPLPYVSSAAKKNWIGRFKAEGSLLTFACSSCARVCFYAAVNDKK